MAAELSLSKLSFRLLKNKCQMSKKIKWARSRLQFTSLSTPNTSELISCVTADVRYPCAQLACGRNLLRSLLTLPLAADGWECRLGVKLQPFSQGLPDLFCVCQHTQTTASSLPTRWKPNGFVTAKNSWV